ncbi:FeoA domain protein [compost metagenome]
MLDRIDALLGHPTRDPHGDPIPTASGFVPRPAAIRLSELDAGACAVVARISDSDPDVLRYLAELGLGLDAEVRVHERREYAGTMAITWGSDASPVHLGLPAASRVWVVPAPLATDSAPV